MIIQTGMRTDICAAQYNEGRKRSDQDERPVYL